MWFWFAVLALLSWSGSDLFSKIGCQDGKDRYAYLKMTIAVGVVMGIHALYEIFFAGVEMNLHVILTYLPVSFLYILSMTIGYLGLRYIELSISSPICNSSGALVSILTIMTTVVAGRKLHLSGLAIAGLLAVIVGVIGLGIVEMTEDEELREARENKQNIQYVRSFLALAIPLIYCLLDALGTFADSLVLKKLDEDSANCAYELTFLVVAFFAAIYVLGIKKDKYVLKMEVPKYVGAICETVGQYFYVHALADESHVMYSAPIISSYCAVSVIWSRLILKERLSWKHYVMIVITVAGIAILGLLDP